MSNVYHILHHPPALEKEDMYVALEQLAERLVASGRLRVDAYDNINFARFSLPRYGVHRIFSARQLLDPLLTPQTQQELARYFIHTTPRHLLPQAVAHAMHTMQQELKKYHMVIPELELRLARILVQSTHPAVMLLLLQEQVEIFVSYAHTVGDFLDMPSWQSHGSSSGLQSIDASGPAVFVSTGGDPFGETKEGAVYGDGFPAIARMMVIGAQEMGHYADIRRNQSGQAVGRYSANFSATRSTREVSEARRFDIKQVQRMAQALQQVGLSKACEQERHIRFYKKVKRRGLAIQWHKLWTIIYRWRFFRRCNTPQLRVFRGMRGRPFPALYLRMMLQDMAFNLEPKADAYARSDPLEEEAIACVEALARVPQQVVKWGHAITRATTPGLYQIYYNTVIPGCVAAYEVHSGQPYRITLRPFSFRRCYKLWQWIRRRPLYRAVPSRDAL